MTEQRARHPRARNVTVVLGPTNTGKTHLAVERMIGHETGMIGLPLRLLAREVYDTVAAKCGAHSVALITGEEKIVPPEPRYFVCTVEAMPSDVKVDFLAIDEVQLCADTQRGHIFTDRILHQRGATETMLLGASTMRGLLAELLPGAHFVSRPRFSRLTYAGQKKITRLPARSAVVCFSADAVYATAELIRRQRGGAAVVLGALSPRTRNAQVALYQSGDVDFLVATDAIGMGLNMDVDHVAFAGTRKFDGRIVRDLTSAELGQIAGRAGRHMNDGTFGVTGEAQPFGPDVIEQLESHSFEAVRAAQWRNRLLDFASIDALAASLARAPDIPGLVRAPEADDTAALDLLSRDEEVRDLARGEEAVRLLWDVCQIPDYRNITGGDHAALLGRLFHFLRTGGVIPSDWFARQVSFADKSDGDIDTLSNRIAHIRTWTFIANKPDWLKDPAEWQDRTRNIEDRLSDALHEQLTRRFIDRRTSVLMKRMKEKEELMSAVSNEGGITVEGQYVGHLKGFHFLPDTAADNAHNRALRAASLKAVAAELAARAQAFAGEPDSAIELVGEAGIEWRGARVARLRAGDDLLRPRVHLLADDQLTGTDRQLVQERLERWLEAQIEQHLGPLRALARDETLQGMARGIAFQLVEGLGVLARTRVADEIRALDQPARGTLRQHGVRFGAYHVFLPALLKPAATRLKLALWALQKERDGTLAIDQVPQPPQQGLTSAPADPNAPDDFYTVTGYLVCGRRAVRIDMLERLADLIRPRVFWKPEKEGDERPEGSVEGGGFTVIPDMMSLVGCSGEEFADILQTLGYRMERRRVEQPPAPAPEALAAAEASQAPDAAAIDAAAETNDAPQATAPAGDAGPTGAAAPDAAADEPTHLEIWRPRGRQKQDGAERRHKGAKGRGRKPAERRHDDGAKGGPKDGAKRRPAPRKKEREPSPDSPFAALGALKRALEEKQSAKS